MALARIGTVCVVMFTTVDSLTQEFSVNHPSRNVRNVIYIFFNLEFIRSGKNCFCPGGS